MVSIPVGINHGEYLTGLPVKMLSDNVHYSRLVTNHPRLIPTGIDTVGYQQISPTGEGAIHPEIVS